MVRATRRPALSRRAFSALLGASLLAPPLAVRAAVPITVVDMAGRSVTLARPVKRIVLLDARDIVSMGIVHPDPARLVVGWAGADTFDSAAVRSLYEARPAGSDPIATVGTQTGDTLSLERIIGLEPDLVVATAQMAPEPGNGSLARQLAAAGIPVLFSSIASNGLADAAGDPLGDMIRTMRMWGSVLGRPAAADAFAAFAGERVDAIRERLRGTTPTTAYLEVQSTYEDCCWAAGQRIWGDLLALAGGRTLSAADAAWYAKVSLEQLIIESPEVYIATGGAYGAGLRPAIGPGLAPEPGSEGLRRLAGRTGFDTLPAVREGRVHGIWTGLLTIAPLNVLFLELAAKWLHPAAFADVDPAATLDVLNRRFLAKPLPGPCWLSLSPA